MIRQLWMWEKLKLNTTHGSNDLRVEKISSHYGVWVTCGIIFACYKSKDEGRRIVEIWQKQ